MGRITALSLSADAAAAALSIYTRRRRNNDPHVSALPNPDDLDYLFATSAYLDRYSGPEIPNAVVAQDSRDQIKIIEYLRLVLDLHEEHAIGRARQRCRTPWIALAHAMGLRHWQAAEQRYLRLLNAHQATTSGRRSVVDARADRNLGRRPSTRPEPEVTDKQITVLAQQFIAAYGLIPEDLWEVLVSVRDAQAPPTALAAMRWLCRELAPRRAELAQPLAALLDRATAVLLPPASPAAEPPTD